MTTTTIVDVQNDDNDNNNNDDALMSPVLQLTTVTATPTLQRLLRMTTKSGTATADGMMIIFFVQLTESLKIDHCRAF